MRYNNDNKEIRIAECRNCSHDIDVTDLIELSYSHNGLNNVVTSLDYCTHFAECCDKPFYLHVDIF